MLKLFYPMRKEVFKGLSSGKEEIDFVLKGSFDYRIYLLLRLKKKLLEELENKKSVDILNKNTSVGAHRDDLEIFINGREARIFGSQGQQRSCVIALKACRIEPS